MTVLDFLIVAAFIAYAVGSGLRNRRAASRNLDEYFLANRSLPGWQAGLSMAATRFAASGVRWRGARAQLRLTVPGAWAARSPQPNRKDTRHPPEIPDVQREIGLPDDARKLGGEGD